MSLNRLLLPALLFCAACPGAQQKPDDAKTPSAAQDKTSAPDDADAGDAEAVAYRETREAAQKAGPAEAEASWRKFLEEHPTSRYKAQAAFELGLVQQKLGKKSEAALTMKSALGAMSEGEKKRAEGELKSAGDPSDALIQSVRAVEGSPEKLQALLEQVAPDGVAQLAARLDHGSPAWPLVAVKLGRLQLHLGDRTHALQTLEEVVAQSGQTPAHQAARALRDELKASVKVTPNLIGIILPRTGKFAAFSNLIVDAISLQIDLQDRGPVRAIIKDSRNEPDGAEQAVEELAKEGVIAILGPIGLTEGTAAAMRAQQLGVPIVSLSRAEGLTSLGPYVFREMTTSSQQARAVSRYAAEKLGAKSFAVLQPDSTAGEDLAHFFWDGVDQASGEMRGYEHYQDRSTNFKKTVQRLVGRDNLAERREFVEEEARIAQEITDPYRKRKALAQLRSAAAPLIDFDVLFLADFASEVRLLAPALAAEDIITNGCDVKELEVVRKTTKKEDLRTVQLLGWMGWDSPELVDERLGAARYVQCSILVDGFYAGSQRPATQHFVDAYQQSYKRVPIMLEAHAHDAAGILKSIIETKKPQTRDDFRDALAHMAKPFEGAAGETTFDQEREAQKPLFWLWINKGNIVEFDPTGQPPVPPVPSAQAAAAQEPNKP